MPDEFSNDDPLMADDSHDDDEVPMSDPSVKKELGEDEDADEVGDDDEENVDFEEDDEDYS